MELDLIMELACITADRIELDEQYCRRKVAEFALIGHVLDPYGVADNIVEEKRICFGERVIAGIFKLRAEI